MQESFNILSSTGSYAVAIGANLLNELIRENPKAIFLVDDRLKDYLPDSLNHLILISAIEKNKSLEYMPEVILKIREAGTNRSSHLVAIGGGVIQDIATFAASIYMRGVKWTYMPTTLLGMVDSCIGGKSSINMLGYKNLVGNFYPPVSVLIDLKFIKTLNQEQVIGGLMEAAKICYARGYSQFKDYLTTLPSYPIDAKTAKEVIFRALTNKKWFIETDEFDQNERLLLNFGHTFGHALEAGTDFGISHGIAVGIGMVIAVEYAKSANLLSALGEVSANDLINHVKSLLGEGLEKVLSEPPEIDLDMVMEKFNNDKKHSDEFYRIIVPNKDGELSLISEPRNDKTMIQIRKAYINGLVNIGYKGYNLKD